jgi:hypothetical protein
MPAPRKSDSDVLDRLPLVVGALVLARGECQDIATGAPEEEHVVSYQRAAHHASRLIDDAITELSR